MCIAMKGEFTCLQQMRQGLKSSTSCHQRLNTGYNRLHARRTAGMLFSALCQETTNWYPFSVKTEQFQTEGGSSEKQIQETEAKGNE